MIEETQLLGAGVGSSVGSRSIVTRRARPRRRRRCRSIAQSASASLMRNILFATSAIFKARQGRLRSQIFSLDRIATHRQLVYRIGTQPGLPQAMAITRA